MAQGCDIVDLPLVRGLLTRVDCNVGDLVQTGYAALSDPSGVTSLALTGALTLFVALFGWRLMLGQSSLTVGDAAGAAIKVGAVLLLAGSWGTYQTVVYDSLYTGPTELAAMLMRAGGDPFDGLQSAVDQMQTTADFYAARSGTASPLVGGIAYGAMLLNGSAMLLMLSTVGLLIASKIALALLLAIAPAIAGLLLFDATRGMVEGWLRAMVALAVTPLSIILLLAMELALLQPVLATMAANRVASRFDVAPMTSIALTVAVFALVVLAAVIAAAMIARGIRLPGGKSTPAQPATSQSQIGSSAALFAGPSRASRVAAAAEASARRDPRATGAISMRADRRADPVSGPARTGPAASAASPLGQTYARAAAPRRSAARSRRDR
jgi:type IV secretion system protein VirB6